MSSETCGASEGTVGHTHSSVALTSPVLEGGPTALRSCGPVRGRGRKPASWNCVPKTPQLGKAILSRALKHLLTQNRATWEALAWQTGSPISEGTLEEFIPPLLLAPYGAVPRVEMTTGGGIWNSIISKEAHPKATTVYETSNSGESFSERERQRAGG